MCMKRDVMGQTAIDGVEGLNRAGELGEIDGFTGSRQLMWGHVLLLVCAVLYLIWWCIFFRPNAQVKGGALRVFGIACILVAAVAGIVGVVLECFGISKLLMHAADFLFESRIQFVSATLVFGWLVFDITLPSLRYQTSLGVSQSRTFMGCR